MSLLGSRTLLARRQLLARGFRPGDLPGLKLWLDASSLSGLADGDPVATWTDRSGNGYHAAAAGVARPTYKTAILNGRPVLRFDGTNHYLITADASSPALAQPSTAFVVGKATVNPGTLIDSGTTLITGLIDRGSVSNPKGVWRLYAGSAVASANETADLKYNVITGQFNGASSLLRVGGLQVAAGNGGAGAFAGLTVGARGGGAAIKLTGDVAEVILYSGALSAGQINQVERYLGSKYALNVLGGTWNLVFEGDSRTLGQGSTGRGAYPLQMVDSYISTVPFIRLTATNSGTGGHTLANMIADAATLDALNNASLERNVLVVWGGTNDFGAGENETTVYNRLVSLCQTHQAAGWYVVVCTELPRSDVQKPAGFDANRALFNAHIRTSWTTFADALADLAANTNIGDDGDSDDVTYYDADKIHINNTGYGVIAGIVAAVLL